jgi:nucleotide-binding universal stress UspA family protein
MTATEADQPNRGEAAPSEDSLFADALCAIDGTPESLAAAEEAAILTGANGHLTLLAVTSFSSEGAYRSPAIGPGRAKRILDRAVQVAHEARVPYAVEVDPASPPSQVILDWASERDLLAMGAPAISWLGAMFTAGVADTALGSFTTPLLIGRSISRELHVPRRVVVASDGLAGSDELVELAGRLARTQGAEAILLHVLGSESSSHPHRIEEQARRLHLAVDGASEVRLQPGHTRGVIVETASAVGASLLVMGSRRLEGLRTIGSVSRRVVHQVDCPVLLVPPERLLQA